MKIKLYGLAIAFGIISFFISCKKDPGPGGTSTIQGRVHAQHVTQGGVIDTSYYDEDDRVYIVYGTSGDAEDDDTRSSFDGSYKFQCLQKGTYRIWVYSKDTTGLYNFTFDHTRPPIPVIKTVEVTSNGQTVNVPDIEVFLYN